MSSKRPRLVRYFAGRVVELEVPLVYLNEHSNEISLRNLLKELVPKPLPTSENAENKAATSDGVVAASQVSTTTQKNRAPSSQIQSYSGQNGFNRFVEDMERKYSVQHLVDVGDFSEDDANIEAQDGSDGDSSSDDDSMEVDRPSGKSSGSGEGKAKEAKKRRRSGIDYYDHDDGFVDDSLVCESIHKSISSKNTKTKSTGFFSSSGRLLADSEDDDDDDDDSLAAPTTSSGKKSVGKSVARPTPGDKDKDRDRDRDVLSPSSPRGAARPVWVPTTRTLQALDRFRNDLLALNPLLLYKLTKTSFIPNSVEAPMRALDAVVRVENEEAVSGRATGYAEAIAACLGTDFIPGKVVRFLKRIHFKEGAEAAKTVLEACLAQLKCVLPSRIVKLDDKEMKDSKDAKDDEEEEKKDKEKEAIKYEFQCRWDAESRKLLYRLDVLCSAWVVAENKRRNAMTAAERQSADAAAAQLVERDEQTGLLTHLCDFCFEPLTKGGDITAMRRQLTTEKTRIKKAEASKEDQRKTIEAAASKWGSIPPADANALSSPTAAGGVLETTVTKSQKKKTPQASSSSSTSGGAPAGSSPQAKKKAPAKPRASKGTNPDPAPSSGPVLGRVYPPHRALHLPDFLELTGEALPQLVLAKKPAAEKEKKPSKRSSASSSSSSSSSNSSSSSAAGETVVIDRSAKEEDKMAVDEANEEDQARAQAQEEAEVGEPNLADGDNQEKEAEEADDAEDFEGLPGTQMPTPTPDS